MIFSILNIIIPLGALVAGWFLLYGNGYIDLIKRIWATTFDVSSFYTVGFLWAIIRYFVLILPFPIAFIGSIMVIRPDDYVIFASSYVKIIFKTLLTLILSAGSVALLYYFPTFF